MFVYINLCSESLFCFTGGSEISVDAAVKFVKQVFRYEQWSVFGSLSSALLTKLHVSNSVQSEISISESQYVHIATCGAFYLLYAEHGGSSVQEIRAGTYASESCRMFNLHAAN